ncbi:malectin domain-containing carbohydrate-binding protein [Saccharicrinis sp. FJH62]|uniref:malectin domain-containing carbohydrate-binding protein n=1 Tax=Saccharicrinis sp. FJH62 TaxID=3344657 RepID=UPI0035D52689
MQYLKTFILPVLLIFILASCGKKNPVRHEISLNTNWQTIANDTNIHAYDGFEAAGFETEGWIRVDVPHNWDDYGGYRRLMHGNRHGYAWYRKTFTVEHKKDKQYFLFFEGVGSYASVWLNGVFVGYHAGGRTTFTLDVTDHVRFDGENILAVRADHPADIRDLPWVCGGCSPEWGFSEGSQPMGIFRPVSLIITDQVRIEPFGVHIWNDTTISEDLAKLSLTTEIKNYGDKEERIELRSLLVDEDGREIKRDIKSVLLKPGVPDTVTQYFVNIDHPNLWSIDDPYLYTVQSSVIINGKVVDEINTPYGIHWTKWDIKGDNPTNRFYLNGKPVFINGTAEYEHMMGQSHAFSKQQILSRVDQIRAAGFNAFRDAHQPHNLRYQSRWDSLGILWWPQMSAHIWYNEPGFKENFRVLLRDWVKERRNSPSIILWGLQNECTMSPEFTRECTDIIREMDPGASTQRLVTTCNGGTGTDWDVIQNWSGTYGGDPDNYDKELSEQLLNGEYGAWRSIDWHSEGGFDAQGPLTEDRMWQLMESKIRLGEAASDRACGQFHWLFNSHDNPGRTQAGEGYRDIDRVGPVNYKGSITIWGEPLDVYYMYRANYAPEETDPMVYIVSHTWPNRWEKPGVKDGINVFSNCDEVELFNGVRQNSLGKKRKGQVGTHFTWNKVDIQTNVLYAVGYENGKEVASDVVILNLLPVDPDLQKLSGDTQPLTDQDKNYLYRVNCGGPDYIDQEGNLWMADVHKDTTGWGSVSWTDNYDNLPAFYGSQRQTWDPIEGTSEWDLIRTYRYGRHRLAYEFPVADGSYRVDLFFVEPWYGTGGGLECENWRLFDVAINDEVMIKDLDIWKLAGHDRLLKKTVQVNVTGGLLKISFPEVKSAQAVISAIAISTDEKDLKPAPPSKRLITIENGAGWRSNTWLNIGDRVYSDRDIKFVSLPPILYSAEWIQTPANPDTKGSIRFKEDADLYIGFKQEVQWPEWLGDFQKLKDTIRTSLNGGTTYNVYRKRILKETSFAFPSSGSEEMYIIAALPVTNLDVPIDRRPTVKYEAEAASKGGKTVTTVILDEPCTLVPGKNDVIEWRFSVGLASKYGLQFRYMNKGKEDVPVEAEIRAADGRLIWKGEYVFPVADVKWRGMRTDTQTTINAGTYTLRLKALKQGPLYFDYLRTQ